ncbi:MAG: ParB N-terminal domain-containing protein [Pseudomonadota bacterium]
MELEFHQIALRYEKLRVRDRGRQARLTASLVEHGQLSEVLVVKGAGGRYVLIDGYRRVEALARLGHDTVRAMVLSMGEKEALMYLYRMEAGARRSALEDGWLLSELCEAHRISQDQLAVQMQRSVSWVSRRLALVKVLPEHIQQLVRKGKLCAYAAGKYLVPLARAKPEHCEKLVEGIKDQGLSTRQIGALYAAWRESGAKQRERIAQQPALFLRAQDEIARCDPPAGPGAESMEKRISGLGGFCRGLRKAIRKQAEATGTGWIDERLRQAWHETLMDMKALIQTGKEVFNAGDGQACGDPAAGRAGSRDQVHRTDA